MLNGDAPSKDHPVQIAHIKKRVICSKFGTIHIPQRYCLVATPIRSYNMTEIVCHKCSSLALLVRNKGIALHQHGRVSSRGSVILQPALPNPTQAPSC